MAGLGNKQARRGVLPVGRHQGLGMLQGLAAQPGRSKGLTKTVAHVRAIRADAPQGAPGVEFLRALLQTTGGAHGEAPGIGAVRLAPGPVGTQGLQFAPALRLEQGRCGVVALQLLDAAGGPQLDLVHPGGQGREIDVLPVAPTIIDDAHQRPRRVHQGPTFRARRDGRGELDVVAHREAPHPGHHPLGDADPQSQGIGHREHPAPRCGRARPGQGRPRIPIRREQAQVAFPIPGHDAGLQGLRPGAELQAGRPVEDLAHGYEAAGPQPGCRIAAHAPPLAVTHLQHHQGRRHRGEDLRG